MPQETPEIKKQWLDKVFTNKNNILCPVDYKFVDIFLDYFEHKYVKVYSDAVECKDITSNLHLYFTLVTNDLNDIDDRPYFVSKICEKISDKYNYLYGYRGNSPCASTSEYNYYSFYLFRFNKKHVCKKDKTCAICVLY